MKAPTRIYRGKRQILFEGVWLNAKQKAINRAVRSAKEILGDESPLATMSELLDSTVLNQLIMVSNQLVMDEIGVAFNKKLDDTILKNLTSGLLGKIDRFTIHQTSAVPLDWKQK